MADDDELYRCVTEFMLDTCLYSPAESHRLLARLGRVAARVVHTNFAVPDIEVFTSGSAAEFYITPLLSCIGDIDLMLCHSGVIAIPAGQTPPTELPDHYQSIVAVAEIVDSCQPGYVYLQQSYILEKNNSGRYVVKNVRNPPQYFANIQTISTLAGARNYFQFQQYLPHDFVNSSLYMMIGKFSLHGPALKSIPMLFNTITEGPPLNSDVVNCMRCLFWPPQAADWSTRSRGHNWPDPSTIVVVVRNACDVVRAVHPSCRQDKWMSNYQWRLSFSRAEVTLLNSWTKVQQILYHMLRFVIKREILTEEYENDPNLPKLSNYHIKTLMLWECEQKPQNWWSAESSLIKLCSSLLHKLSDYVAAKCCQQYFINNCNLLDHFMDYDDDASLMLCGRLKGLADVPVLLSWFVNNYILHSAKRSMLFDNIGSTNITAQIRILANYHQKEIQLNRIEHRQVQENVIMFFLQSLQADKFTQMYMEELQNHDAALQDYFVALKSLHVAYNTSIHSLTKDHLEILWTLFNPCGTGVGNNDITSTSGLLLSASKAIKLASLCSTHSNALDMLCDEMSKAYLHQSFAYGQESTYCVVHVLLSILYYKSRHYQAAINHCKQVLNHTNSTQYGLRSIAAEYLPQIDENVDAVIGLILFHDHARQNALKSINHLQLNNADQRAFTTELLARYLYSQCSSVVDAEGDEESVYRKHLFHVHKLLLSDVLLFKTVDTQLNKCTKVKIPLRGIRAQDHGNAAESSMDTSLLVTSLELVALEKLITYRQMMVRELHSEQYPVLNEFEALYAYKCGLFEECLEMCRSYLNMTLHLDCWKDQFFPVLLPEMLILLDGELVSLFGIVRLINPVHFLAFVLYHPCLLFISVRTLLLYLMVQCQKKLCINMHDTVHLIPFVHESTESTDLEFDLDQIILKMIYRSLILSINDY